MSLQEEVQKLKEENELYNQNGPIGLYYELNRFINATVKIMRNTSLEKLLSSTKDEDPKRFEKTMALIKNAKEHVADMYEMKEKLNLTGDEEKDKRKPFITTVAQNRH